MAERSENAEILLRYGIQRLSPSLLSNWAKDPAFVVLTRATRVYGMAGPRAWVGIALEAGVVAYLRTKDEALARKAAETAFADCEMKYRRYLFSAGFNPDLAREEAEAERRNVPQALATAIACMPWRDDSATPQFQVRVANKAMGIPFLGYIDVMYPDQIIDIKYVGSLFPIIRSGATEDHAMQVALYAKMKRVDSASLYYTSTDGFAECPIEGKKLEAGIKRARNLTEDMLMRLDEADGVDDFLRRNPPRLDHWLWSDPAVRAKAMEVCNEL